MDSRIGGALAALEARGGSARVQKENEKLVICSESCPLATAVAEHPEVCRLAETLLSEIIGVKVREHCDREGSPRAVSKSLEVNTEKSKWFTGTLNCTNAISNETTIGIS